MSGAILKTAVPPASEAECGDSGPEIFLSASACRALWASVLLALWDDSFGRGSTRAGAPGWRLQRDACDWFGSRDFAEVCFLAGLDARAVLGRCRALQAQLGSVSHG